nr:MAG TPA: hypothetical protein [Caudoviricetes sp.]
MPLYHPNGRAGSCRITQTTHAPLSVDRCSPSMPH